MPLEKWTPRQAATEGTSDFLMPCSVVIDDPLELSSGLELDVIRSPWIAKLLASKYTPSMHMAAQFFNSSPSLSPSAVAHTTTTATAQEHRTVA